MRSSASRNIPFFRKLYRAIDEHGGLFNSHLHLDRAFTLDDPYIGGSGDSYVRSAHVSLHEKHSRITGIHAGPAYDRPDLERRVNACIDAMIEAGTRRADTLVDVTADRVKLSAFETLEEIGEARSDEIDLRVGAYSPFGFRDDEPERWELMVEGARRSGFMGFLPEADDTDEYPDHIGFYEHCRRALALARSEDKPIHVHTDQRNEPSERGTERLLEAVREFGAPESASGEPMVWAVHAISPTTYEEGRFRDLAEGLCAENVGVICCPTAALGMRQLRTIPTPTDNSMPRVLDLLDAGVRVLLASDNIADACSPSTTPDLVDEVLVLSAGCRFYDPEVLGKLAAGTPLVKRDLEVVREHLEENRKEVARIVAMLPVGLR